MIVTAKPPWKRRPEPRKAAIGCPVVVSARKPGRKPYASLKAEPDPEAEARVREFFSRMIRPER